MRLVFGAGVLVGVVAILLSLHAHEFVGYRTRVHRQPVDVNAAQARHQFGLMSSLMRLSICASRFCSTT